MVTHRWENPRKTYYGPGAFTPTGGLNLLRLPILIIIVGAILTAAGAVLFLVYPSLIISAVDVEEFQDQWRSGNDDTFADYDSGDTVYIKDEIAGVHYDEAGKVTVVRFAGKGSLGDLEFHFKGKVYDNFAKEDKVIIKDEVTRKDGKETLQGLDTSLDEENIQHLYGSSAEMALGLLAVAGIVVMVAGAIIQVKGIELGGRKKKDEEIEPYEMAPPSGALPDGAQIMQPGMQPMMQQPGYQPGMQQMIPGYPAPQAAGPVTVACPTCQQHLMIADPTRPLTVACPHCANPLMVQ